MQRAILAITALAALAAALSACETPYPLPPPPPPPERAPPPGPTPEFRAHDFAWSAERGSAAIRGQVEFTQGSQRYTCLGQTVVLTPEAPYSRARIVALYGSADRAALPVDEVRSRQEGRPSADFSAFVRKVQCDNHDRFAFQGLPAGAWFVIVVGQPTGPGGEPMALMKRVETRAGTAKSVTVP